MNNDILQNTLKTILFNDGLKIKVIDVFDDVILSYEMNNQSFNLTNKESFSIYLENTKNVIDSSYLSGFMNCVSLNKLKEALKTKLKEEFNYKKINGKEGKIVSTIINTNGKELIFSLIDENADVSNKEIENDFKYEDLLSRVTDSILKINNVFNLDNNKKMDVKNIEEYINAVINNLVSSHVDLKQSFSNKFANVTGRLNDTILIVDDDMITRNMIKKVFEEDYKIVMAQNGKEAIDYLKENSSKGVLESSDNIVTIFLDLTMPVMDGFSVLEYLSKNNYLTRIPVVIISGDYEKETKARVYNYAIADMLEKPFDYDVVKHRINNFINLYKSSNSLSNLVSSQNNDIKDLLNNYIESYFYDYDKDIKRVSSYLDILLNKVKQDYPEYELDDEKIEKIKDASRYYDIGFNALPKTLLTKKESLTKEEIEKIKSYPIISGELIDYVLSLKGDALYKEYAKNIALCYHENVDGTGYPNKLSNDKIPLESKVASVCILYNNLKKKNTTNIDNLIISKSGVMFDPKVIGSFMKVKDEFNKIN